MEHMTWTASSRALELYESIVSDGAARKLLLNIGCYHPGTARHMLRVCLMGVQMGYDNGTEEGIHDLGYGALLHDAGKHKVPLSILNENGVLTPRKREILKVHVEGLAEELCGFPERVIYIAGSHHAFKRVGPYPEDRVIVPEWEGAAKKLAVADYYDVIINGRCYNHCLEPLSRDGIRERLREELAVEEEYIDLALLRHAQP
jgi:hypothetical protein